ncbi:MAG: 1,4-dihydroxy-2-naphthoate octaprenyltransferase [Firmicutes bacterium]|nr:1,4-dihydroxy-2-naphthoate octaprenyltransferase [Bacillota bacterium]
MTATAFQMKNWMEIVRPFAWPATLVPVLTGAFLALVQGVFHWYLFLPTIVGAILIQAGTNVINEVYDVQNGVDNPQTQGGSRVLLEGRMTSRTAWWGGVGMFAAAALIGFYLVAQVGWGLLIIGIVAIAAGYLYTGGSFAYKYVALGVPLVFLLMGPLETLASYFAQTGRFSWVPVLYGLPIGFHVTLILQANDLRDLEWDKASGIRTVATQLGTHKSKWLYDLLLFAPYFIVAIFAFLPFGGPFLFLPYLTLPMAWQRFVAAQHHQAGQPDIPMLEPQSAQLHLYFGSLLAVGILLNGWIF